MREPQTTQYHGLGVLPLLGLLFVALKLTGFIGWSWWWVTAPFWGGIALVAVIVVALALYGAFKS